MKHYLNLRRFEKQVRHYKLYYEDGYHFVGELIYSRTGVGRELMFIMMWGEG